MEVFWSNLLSMQKICPGELLINKWVFRLSLNNPRTPLPQKTACTCFWISLIIIDNNTHFVYNLQNAFRSIILANLHGHSV